MAETSITEIKLDGSKEEFSLDDNITITARFSIMGDLRESFTEKNWTDAYEKNDNTFKLKYGIKLLKTGLRKHEVGKPIDTYRKASIFWTRNPKLVNPMKEKRIWVQVAKNFEPFIRLTEEEVRQELFDFSEEIHFSLEVIICFRELDVLIAESVADIIWPKGLLFEFTRIQISLVKGCLLIIPAKSVFLSFSSSCCMIYKVAISPSFMETAISSGFDSITSTFI